MSKNHECCTSVLEWVNPWSQDDGCKASLSASWNGKTKRNWWRGLDAKMPGDVRKEARNVSECKDLLESDELSYLCCVHDVLLNHAFENLGGSYAKKRDGGDYMLIEDVRKSGLSWLDRSCVELG